LYAVNYMSMSFMIFFLPLNFPAVIALDGWGLRDGVLIGLILTVIGLWVKCLINQSFIFAIIGQTILAISQPFLMNAPAKVSANWFGERERVYATSASWVASLLGAASGYFMCSLFVSDAD
jgi:hypothetical protein